MGQRQNEGKFLTRLSHASCDACQKFASTLLLSRLHRSVTNYSRRTYSSN